MIEIRIPGFKDLALQHLVLDFNGTLACDGRLLDGVPEILAALARDVEVHVLTADTFGTTAEACRDVPCRVTILPPDGQAAAKQDFVRKLGSERVACIGNGRNDRLMLWEAALGIAVIGPEGAASEAMVAADVVCRDAKEALSLLLHPKRLVASLRS